MTWLETVLARLESADAWGYHVAAPSATEPAALAAIALLAHRRVEQAKRPLAWLVKLQAADGSLGVDAEQATPGWATSLAILAWNAAQATALADARCADARERALRWLLSIEGSRFPRQEGLGHDSMLAGWPWVVGTHSWVEPTAMALLALKHSGQGEHARARDAALLLKDRLLETGGCNYGNTYVFGQMLRAHVQPTGMALLALAGESDTTGGMQKSLEYLERELPRMLATDSLCYGLLGAAAQQQAPAAADAWLEAASSRTIAREPSAYKLALLALAGLGSQCPLIITQPARKAS